MIDSAETQVWPEGSSPADAWDARATKRVLDELFCFARKYRSSKAFQGLLKFIVGFRCYAPFNAMLVRTQMQGARFVAPAHRWAKKYRRRIKVNARPLVILQPMGPVMFVFDVSDTDPLPDADPLPREVTHPFEVLRGLGLIGHEWDLTVRNAKRDGIDVQPQKEGSQSGGSIRPADRGKFIAFPDGKDSQGEAKSVAIPHRYDVLFNRLASKEARYATLAHELGHLYCGHLGTPNRSWWPDRQGLDNETEEFEAESVAYLVCGRLGIETPSAEYLALYFGRNAEVPNISIDAIMKSAGLIEQMGREPMKPRKVADKGGG